MFDQIKKMDLLSGAGTTKGIRIPLRNTWSVSRNFTGNVAPGLVIGGSMIDLALRSMPEEILFDVICETFNCLPDAIQLLTPCTVGNGWLTVLDLGHFALTFYDKYTGEGIRVFLDSSKVSAWPETQRPGI